MSNIADRVFVVTGANNGIGRVTAQELAARGGRVILACRNREKTMPVVEEIIATTGNKQVRFVPLDLSSLSSVKACAEQLLEEEPHIHVLINNAGIAGAQGITQDGFELAFGVNHIGHFLLTLLLLERLKASTPARIVNVSSRNHLKTDGIDFGKLQQTTSSMTGLPEYAVSKLSNVLFTKELARRLEGTGVTTYSLHPGVVASNIWRRVPWPIRPLMKRFMLSNEEGALTSLHCATAPELASESGFYYDACSISKTNPAAEDDELVKKLWESSEAWVRDYLPNGATPV